MDLFLVVIFSMGIVAGLWAVYSAWVALSKWRRNRAIDKALMRARRFT